MPAQKQAQNPVFMVIDAMDAPHHGRIIRLRLQGGHPPACREMKGATLLARSPKGDEEALTVLGFFLPGGRPSDARLSRTGRIDLVVGMESGNNHPAVSARWEVTGPQ